MSIIKDIKAALVNNSLVVGKPELNAMRIYANNRKKHPQNEVDQFLLSLIIDGRPWPLTEEFQKDSRRWIAPILWTGEGHEWRDSIQTRKFTPEDRYVMDTFSMFCFVRMHNDASEPRYRALPEYRPVFRAVGKDGAHFEFYHRPWQATLVGETPGFVITKHAKTASVAQFVQGYITAALWSSHGDEGDCENLDDKYDKSDIHPDTLALMQRECAEFVVDNVALLVRYREKIKYTSEYTPWERAGHDFWLTRNRHGAGFWDRGLGKLGDRLTTAANKFKECTLIVGDDKKIHQE